MLVERLSLKTAGADGAFYLISPPCQAKCPASLPGVFLDSAKGAPTSGTGVLGGSADASWTAGRCTGHVRGFVGWGIRT